MEPINDIQKFQKALQELFPRYRIVLDPPDNEAENWFLDVLVPHPSPLVVVEWRPDQGFGVSADRDHDFGLGPDEVYTDIDAAFDRVVELIRTGAETTKEVEKTS